jgi:hypothetical protein
MLPRLGLWLSCTVSALAIGGKGKADGSWMVSEDDTPIGNDKGALDLLKHETLYHLVR